VPRKNSRWHASVSVWFTHPAEDVYRTWFLCSDCDFHTRAQLVDRPPCFLEGRVNDETGRARSGDSQAIDFEETVPVNLSAGSSPRRDVASDQRRLHNGGISEPQPLAAEPVWNAAVAFAWVEIAQGVSLEDFKLPAYRSAEFQVVNQMLFQGSEMKNIVCITTAALA